MHRTAGTHILHNRTKTSNTKRDKSYETMRCDTDSGFLPDMPCNNFVTALVRAQNMQGAGISFELNRDSTRTRMSSDRRLTLGAPYKQLTLEN